MDQRGREDLKPLTSLRFVAALLVLVDHAPLTRGFAERYFLGESGVGFFFILSGFILTWTYHRSFSERVSWAAARDFYVARIARVYPLVVTTTFLAAAVIAVSSGRIGGQAFTESLVTELTMTKAWFPVPAIAYGLNPPSWSIADECFFYAVFPALAWYLLRSLRAFAGTMALASAATLWVVVALSFLAHPPSAWFASYFPPIRLLDFTFGIFAAIAFIKGTRLPRGWATEWIALAGIALAISCQPHVPASLRFSLACAPFWTLLILAFSGGSGALSRALSAPTMVRLGEISFAFYLLHEIVISALTPRLGTGVIALLSAMTVTMALSFALFLYVETPMRSRIRGALARTRMPKGTPASTARTPSGAG